MKRIKWGFLVWLACMGMVSAQDLSGEGQQAESDGFFLFGVGEYRHLNESLYLGALHVPLLDVRIRPDSPKFMEMRITAETLSARRFTRHWMDGLTLSSSREERIVHADAIRQFSDLFTMEFSRGDRVRFFYQPDQSRVVVSINGVVAGIINDLAFYSFLLSAWIGDTPVSSTLKDGILGQGDIDQDSLKQMYGRLQYSEERRQVVAGHFGQQQGTPATDDQALSQATAPEPSQSAESTGAEGAEPTSLTVAAPALSEEAARLAAELEAARKEAQRLEAERREAERREAERQEREAEARRLAEERRRHQQAQEQLAEAHRDRLISWIQQFAEYPQKAMERGHEGKVELTVSTDRAGGITRKEILQKSGSYLLDKAAIEILEKSEPLPAMPESLEGEVFTFTMPFSFAL